MRTENLRRIVVAAATIVLLCIGRAYGQIPPLPEIFSSPLPTGSGARALGSGGAFLALADDATAASWNPAGLRLGELPTGQYRALTQPEIATLWSAVSHDPD